MSNVFVRFLYQIFLEVCICVMINITIMNKDSFTSGLLWLSSLVIIIAIGVSLLLMASLFWRNGPFVQNTYEEKSLLKSFWSSRPLKQDIIEEMEYEIEDQKIRETELVKPHSIMIENGSAEKFVDVFIQDCKLMDSLSEKQSLGGGISEEQKVEQHSKNGSSFRVGEIDPKVIRQADRSGRNNAFNQMLSPCADSFIPSSVGISGYFKPDTLSKKSENSDRHPSNFRSTYLIQG